jgi:hypothetical protein
LLIEWIAIGQRRRGFFARKGKRANDYGLHARYLKNSANPCTGKNSRIDCWKTLGVLRWHKTKEIRESTEGRALQSAAEIRKSLL